MLSKENGEVENIFWSKLKSKTRYKKTQITPKFLFWQNGISLWFYFVVISLSQSERRKEEKKKKKNPKQHYMPWQ